jgi:hypothetical protein
MEALLNWMVFAGAITYGRKLKRKDDPARYDAIWKDIWNIQWERKYPLSGVKG